MASYNSFAAAAAPYRALGQILSGNGPDIRAVNAKVGGRAQQIARRVIAGDLGGDDRFSGWAEAPLAMTYIDATMPGPGIVFHPTRDGAGPTTVATVGRNKGNASGFQGPGANARTGATSRTKSGAVRKVRARKNKRWNGYTQGKGTADKIVAALNSELPEVVATGIFDITNRTLGG